jgi:hypothetical protein
MNTEAPSHISDVTSSTTGLICFCSLWQHTHQTGETNHIKEWNERKRQERHELNNGRKYTTYPKDLSLPHIKNRAQK